MYFWTTTISIQKQIELKLLISLKKINHSNFLWLIFFLALSANSCAIKPKGPINYETIPAPPNYADENYWAALPQKDDPADSLPTPDLEDVQANADADVFFLHPTTYLGKLKKYDHWIAPVNNEQLNERTDGSTILYQASIFNGAGKIYAPRYRQAHIEAYFTEKYEQPADEALAFAYQDVKRAFQYYLDHYNKGRPIIIAAHSQGTTHAVQLLKDFFDEKPLKKQLVVAYLVGIPVLNDTFKAIKPCTSNDDLQCFCAWQTFKKGYYPDYQPPNSPVVATNPLTWTTRTTYAPKSKNLGGILRNFNRKFPELCDAEVHDGLLWVNKPKFPGSIFIISPRYHIVDYNLFYYNIRQNAQTRVAAFLKN